MNILPWLLDWPPTRRQVLVFVVITAFSLGSIAVLGTMTGLDSDGEVTITETNLSIHLNENIDIPDTNGSVEDCLAIGTPGGHYTLRGEVTVHTTGSSPPDREVVIQVGDGPNHTVGTVERSGSVTVDVHTLEEERGTFSPGDEVSVNSWILEDETVVASTTSTVLVENASRSYDC